MGNIGVLVRDYQGYVHAALSSPGNRECRSNGCSCGGGTKDLGELKILLWKGIVYKSIRNPDPSRCPYGQIVSDVRVVLNYSRRS
jgi:hypothetical protein